MKAYLLRKANGDNAIFPAFSLPFVKAYLKIRYTNLYYNAVSNNRELTLVDFNTQNCRNVVGFDYNLTMSIYRFELNNIRDNRKSLILSVYEHYDKEFL